MVCEHNARGFAPEWLSETFSTAAFGNSVVAITAGMVAQSAADSVKLAPTSEGSSIMYGGFCMPFDLAIIVLIIGGSVLYSTWAENYGSDGVEPATSADVEGGGEKSADAPPSVDPKKVELTFANLVDVQGLQKGITLMRRDPVIAICGMLQSLFEGSMYIFVFMWTPALTPAPASASAGGEESEGGGHIRRRMLLGRLLVCVRAIAHSQHRHGHNSSRLSRDLRVPTLIADNIHNAISPLGSSICSSGVVGRVIS